MVAQPSGPGKQVAQRTAEVCVHSRGVSPTTLTFLHEGLADRHFPFRGESLIVRPERSTMHVSAWHGRGCKPTSLARQCDFCRGDQGRACARGWRLRPSVPPTHVGGGMTAGASSLPSSPPTVDLVPDRVGLLSPQTSA